MGMLYTVFILQPEHESEAIICDIVVITKFEELVYEEDRMSCYFIEASEK